MFTISAYEVTAIIVNYTERNHTRIIPKENIIKIYMKWVKTSRSDAEEVVERGLSQLKKYDMVRDNGDGTVEYLLAKV